MVWPLREEDSLLSTWSFYHGSCWEWYPFKEDRDSSLGPGQGCHPQLVWTSSQQMPKRRDEQRMVRECNLLSDSRASRFPHNTFVCIIILHYILWLLLQEEYKWWTGQIMCCMRGVLSCIPQSCLITLLLCFLFPSSDVSRATSCSWPKLSARSLSSLISWLSPPT